MVNENIKVQKKALFKRFWWVGLIAVVLISVVVFIGSLGNKKIGPAQDSPTQKSPTQNKTTQNKCNQLGLQAKIILKEKIFMEMLVVFEIRTN